MCIRDSLSYFLVSCCINSSYDNDILAHYFCQYVLLKKYDFIHIYQLFTVFFVQKRDGFLFRLSCQSRINSYFYNVYFNTVKNLTRTISDTCHCLHEQYLLLYESVHHSCQTRTFLILSPEFPSTTAVVLLFPRSQM